MTRFSLLPVSEEFQRRLRRFPIRLEKDRFVFDGRAYSAPEDGIRLTNPAQPLETLALGNSRDAVFRLRRGRRGAPAGGYRVVSGELSKEGRFTRVGNVLAIDRDSDRDEIGTRETFYRSLTEERREGVLWRFREAERGAVEKLRSTLGQFLRTGEKDAWPLTVVLYPDPATKALYQGSSRPADLSIGRKSLTVEVDVSAPAEPDLISPVLAAAALSRGNSALAARPGLALAAGARAYGRWWGRDVRGFAAFLNAARVEPSVAEVLAPRKTGWGSRDGHVSPVFSVGAAASWLEAGARSEGEPALERAFALPDVALAATLSRWRSIAIRVASAPPRRRAMPSGFQRGVSYAMSNSVQASYASPRSRATLSGIRKMSVNAISIMPYAFSQDAASPEIAFVHLHPAGETDEGTVRAVSDARSLGMTTMVKPQIWLGGGQFVGAVTMRSEEDWRRWFDAYRRFVVHNAVVAEASAAAFFCAGTELAGTEAREKEWRQTIAAVRLATGAPLLYASNWAAGAVKVPFWDALDAIGADFYDPLSADPAATDGELREGVRRAARPLSRLARQYGKPVLFAEAGYPPFRGAWTAPHQEESEKPSAPEDAARAIAAVFAALEGEAWWKGVYWWKVFSDGHAGDPKARNFNFLEMPAGEAIASGFQRLAARASGS